MINVAQEFIDVDKLSKLSIAELLSIRGELTKSNDIIDVEIDEAIYMEDEKTLKEKRNELFYILGNISNVEDIIMDKTENVFETTKYAEICYN